MNLYIFEDDKYKNFFPITCTRPVYLMRAGILPVYKKIQNWFKAETFGFICREQLALDLAKKYPDFPVNIIKKGDEALLLLNGRVAKLGDLADKINSCKTSSYFLDKNNEIAAVLFKYSSMETFPAVATGNDYLELFKSQKNNLTSIPTTAVMYNYNWEIMADIHESIKSDYELLKNSLKAPSNLRIHQNVNMVNQDSIYLGENVEILPSVVLNASAGPIYIDSNVRIESQVTINGPCYIGPNTVVMAGKISGCSIGHTCRVGGEIEESIFHSYVNKYHDGFIGHSYVGSWVNFGAMTTNSDLKNNYSNIRVTLNGETIDTNSMKVGSFIGDHTKFGIGTLLNTGIHIGVSCNIYGGGLITDKEIPSFSWGNTGNYVTYEYDKAIDTAKKVYERRSQFMSDAEQEILKSVFYDNLNDDGILNFI